MSDAEAHVEVSVPWRDPATGEKVRLPALPATPIYATAIDHPSAWKVGDFKSPADLSAGAFLRGGESISNFQWLTLTSSPGCQRTPSYANKLPPIGLLARSCAD